ncbi:hypothetical protein NQZ68_027506 [Dissostichus eleginoides]|nr:hypothetical protein NQZ68_027506 [Dissostichus eleginoides]
MCLLGWMKRGIHARADRRAARRVITPSHSAPVCPGSCPNTQTARLAPHIKDLRPDGSLGSGPAQHRGRLCHRPGKSQRSTNAVVITVENPTEMEEAKGASRHIYGMSRAGEESEEKEEVARASGRGGFQKVGVKMGKLKGFKRASGGELKLEQYELEREFQPAPLHPTPPQVTWQRAGRRAVRLGSERGR